MIIYLTKQNQDSKKVGKPGEPKVITDLNQKVVRLLPIRFYFNDERWEMIFDRYEEKGNTLSMADLKVFFPEVETVQAAADDSGETLGKYR